MPVLPFVGGVRQTQASHHHHLTLNMRQGAYLDLHTQYAGVGGLKCLHLNAGTLLCHDCTSKVEQCRKLQLVQAPVYAQLEYRDMRKCASPLNNHALCTRQVPDWPLRTTAAQKGAGSQKKGGSPEATNPREKIARSTARQGPSTHCPKRMYKTTLGVSHFPVENAA